MPLFIFLNSLLDELRNDTSIKTRPRSINDSLWSCHAMTCLMAYHNKKRTEAISIMLQSSCMLSCSLSLNLFEFSLTTTK